MTHLSETIADAARTARQTLKDDTLGAALAAKLTRQLAKQDTRLDVLEKRVKDLGWENRRGGGVPWGLLLLVGGGYALYRTNPGILDRVRGLLGQADPGVEGNLNRAGEAAKSALQAGLRGDDPSGSAKAAVGEVKRAGEKVGDALKDRAETLTDRLKD